MRKPVDPRVRFIIAAHTKKHGDTATAREIGYCVNTLARVLAGLEVTGGTDAASCAFAERLNLPA